MGSWHFFQFGGPARDFEADRSGKSEFCWVLQFSRFADGDFPYKGGGVIFFEASANEFLIYDNILKIINDFEHNEKKLEKCNESTKVLWNENGNNKQKSWNSQFLKSS